MAAGSRTLITDLPKGHEFPLATFTLSRDDVSRYLDAVGDGNTVYLDRGLAPPLAVAALALGSLLEVIELPAGTLHTGQEVDVHAGVPIGAALSLAGRIAQRSQRAGMVIVIIEFDVTPEGALSPALSGRSTVMVAGGAS